MRVYSDKKKLMTILLLAAALGVCPAVDAKADIVKRRATVLRMKGVVDIYQKLDSKWTVPEKGMVLHEKDIIRTREESYLDINIKGIGNDPMAFVRIKDNTELTLETLALDQVTGDQETLLDLAIGTVLIKADKLEGESRFEVYTPTSMVAVRGTIFEVSVKSADKRE